MMVVSTLIIQFNSYQLVLGLIKGRMITKTMNFVVLPRSVHLIVITILRKKRYAIKKKKVTHEAILTC